MSDALITTESFSPAWRDRFWSRVHKSDGCWEWTRGHVPRGYGCVCTKAIAGLRKQDYTHRIAWMLEHGAIPQGLQVLHECDNPPCVRPEHLFLGDQLANVRDMISKGRAVRPTPKLTPEIVRELRERYAAGGVTFADLAADYGIVFQHAHAIVRGTRWGNLHV